MEYYLWGKTEYIYRGKDISNAYSKGILVHICIRQPKYTKLIEVSELSKSNRLPFRFNKKIESTQNNDIDERMSLFEVYWVSKFVWGENITSSCRKISSVLEKMDHNGPFKTHKDKDQNSTCRLLKMFRKMRISTQM